MKSSRLLHRGSDQGRGVAPRTTAERVTLAGRMAISLLALGAVFGLFWLALPILRTALQPVAPPGGWVLGPPVALRFAACAVLSACSFPWMLRPLGRRWRERDLAERGAPLDPLAASPARKTGALIQGMLLLAVYGAGGAFYFTSYTEVLLDRIIVHGPLGARSHGYAEVSAMELQAPTGGQPERYALRFKDGRWAYFGSDAEGTTSDEISAIAAHLSARTGLSWLRTQRR